jgi:hypothetical protein
MALSAKLQGFSDRVAAIADRSTAMSRLSEWMQKNLRLNGRPYNFNKHEMQRAIAEDQHPHKAVKKCAQVGLTELSLRIAAALAGVTRSRIIYVFPSATFAQKVSADRFLPIVRDSPTLSAMQHNEVKSSAMRKLGNSTVYFVGASGTTQAISIPATHLIVDEEDFCDMVVLGQFNARLAHAEEDLKTGLRGVIQRFSTPTIPNYGISKHFDDSDQKSYTVKCSKCNTTQVPDYYNDFVIPGYDDAMAMFGKTDLNNPKFQVDKTYIKCNKCGQDLWKDLIDPSRREWVAKYPDRIMMSGYQVSPFDVPEYNKAPAIIRKLGVSTIQDHRNFVLGREHEDINNSFLPSVFKNCTDASFLSMSEAKQTTLSGIIMGVDIGKVSHFMIGKRPEVSGKRIDIIAIGTISIATGKTLAEQLQELIDAYNIHLTVLDAGPDFSTPQTLIADNLHGSVYGCEYYRKVSASYSNVMPDPETGVVKADRSGTLTDTMRAHNSGHFRYPAAQVEEVKEVKLHLEETKKVTKVGEMGDSSSFPKTGKADHYAHSLNYLKIADELAHEHSTNLKGVPAMPSVTCVVIGSGRAKRS